MRRLARREEPARSGLARRGQGHVGRRVPDGGGAAGGDGEL